MGDLDYNIGAQTPTTTYTFGGKVGEVKNVSPVAGAEASVTRTNANGTYLKGSLFGGTAVGAEVEVGKTFPIGNSNKTAVTAYANVSMIQNLKTSTIKSSEMYNGDDWASSTVKHREGYSAVGVGGKVQYNPNGKLALSLDTGIDLAKNNSTKFIHTSHVSGKPEVISFDQKPNGTLEYHQTPATSTVDAKSCVVKSTTGFKPHIGVEAQYNVRPNVAFKANVGTKEITLGAQIHFKS
jgi:hypothetical protein